VQGYATGQFGKNHLGDLNKYLPTVHGSTSSSATSITSMRRKSPRIPTIRTEGVPEIQGGYGPRGVLHCWATDVDDRRSSRAGVGSASRRSRTPVR